MAFSIFIELGVNHHNQFWKIFITTHSTLPSLAVTSQSFLNPFPRQPIVYFLPLHICLFWTFHMSRSYNVTFCDWTNLLSILFLRFISVAADMNISFFLLSNNISLYEYTTFYLLLVGRHLDC